MKDGSANRQGMRFSSNRCRYPGLSCQVDAAILAACAGAMPLFVILCRARCRYSGPSANLDAAISALWTGVQIRPRRASKLSAPRSLSLFPKTPRGSGRRPFGRRAAGPRWPTKGSDFIESRRCSHLVGRSRESSQTTPTRRWRQSAAAIPGTRFLFARSARHR